MSRRNFSQPSLADAFVNAYSRVGGFLEDIAKTFEWAAFGVLMGPLHSSSDGAPAYPPLTMFKIVLLQQWYGLSDPGAEEAVRDRLSFRRFCGIPLDQETPDHSSIWRFRQRIEKLGLSEKLLAEVNRQLDARGLIVKRGTLVDATIIAAAVKPPSFEEGVVSERDPDASFTVKNNETSFGYKAHLAVDEESGLVRQAEMTSADLHDSQRGEAMIQGDEAAYYADDKAYDSQALRDKLGELGIEDRIAYKAKRNKPLVNWQVWFNKTASRIRVGVEPFAPRQSSSLSREPPAGRAAYSSEHAFARKVRPKTGLHHAHEGRTLATTATSSRGGSKNGNRIGALVVTPGSRKLDVVPRQLLGPVLAHLIHCNSTTLQPRFRQADRAWLQRRPVSSTP